jgi:hypothetical protein
MQATAGGLRAGLIDGGAPPAVPDPERFRRRRAGPSGVSDVAISSGSLNRKLKATKETESDV